jgi:2-oxoisovalerate dehydrogenase E1 component beta subunit
MITECGIIGVAVGMGAYDLRPVPEIQFADYIYLRSILSCRRPRGCATARRAVHLADHGALAVRRRRFGRRTLARARGAIYAHVGDQDGDRQRRTTPRRAADSPRSGTATRHSSSNLYNGPFGGCGPPVAELSEASRGRGPDRLLQDPSSAGRGRARGAGAAILAYGTMVHVCTAVRRRAGSTPRSSTCTGAARHPETIRRR